MKFQIVFFAASLLGFISAFPSNIVDFETDMMDIEQEGIAGKAVEGEYSWIAPNGDEVYVKYVADNRGFRVLENENTIAGGGEFEATFDRASSGSSSAAEEEEPASGNAIEVIPVLKTAAEPSEVVAPEVEAPVEKAAVVAEAEAEAPAEEEEEGGAEDEEGAEEEGAEEEEGEGEEEGEEEGAEEEEEEEEGAER